MDENPPSLGFFFLSLKGAKQKFGVCGYSPWAPVKGGWGSPAWSHVRRVWSRRNWGDTWGSGCGNIGAQIYQSSTAAILRRASFSQGKINDLTLWHTAPSTLWKIPSPQPLKTCLLLSAYFILVLFQFCYVLVLCLFIFFQPSPHLASYPFLRKQQYKHT